MLLFRKPSPETLRRFLDRQSEGEFTYRPVGATSGRPPAGYVVDHTRVRLGSGETVFARARAALENWQQFRLGWLEVWPPTAPAQRGGVLAIVAHILGLWWLNACRIVCVIDEQARRRKFAFAYGTLPDHAASGEERFQVEMDEEGAVWYDVLAFSRPQEALICLGYPYMRHLQKQFGKQSAAAMREIVRSDAAMNPHGSLP